MRTLGLLLVSVLLFGVGGCTTVVVPAARGPMPAPAPHYGGPAPGWCKVHDERGRLVMRILVNSASECNEVGRRYLRPAPPPPVYGQPVPVIVGPPPGRRRPPPHYRPPYYGPQDGWNFSIGVGGHF